MLAEAVVATEFDAVFGVPLLEALMFKLGTRVELTDLLLSGLGRMTTT